VEVTDTSTAVVVIAGILIAIGIAGIVIPGMPGIVVAWLGVLVWAIFGDGGAARWTIFALVSFLALLGMVTKYALPTRSMRQTGVPTRSLVFGGVLAIIGFFVVPVIGLFLGFVLGVFLAELVRLSTPALAWPSTVAALKAVGFSIIIELFFAFTIAAVWVFGVLIA